MSSPQYVNSCGFWYGVSTIRANQYFPSAARASSAAATAHVVPFSIPATKAGSASAYVTAEAPPFFRGTSMVLATPTCRCARRLLCLNSGHSAHAQNASLTMSGPADSARDSFVHAWWCLGFFEP